MDSLNIMNEDKVLGISNQGTIYANLAYNFVESELIYSKTPTWVDNSTIFLANFNGSLLIGNITSPIDGFRIKRKASDGNFYVTLADLANTETSFNDLTARNNIEYSYLLNTIDTNGNEDLGVEVTGILDFFGWFLTDGTDIYKFDANLKTDSIKTNRAMNVFETYSQYPTISFGNRNYRTSSLTTIPYSFNTEYTFTYALLEELRTFINSETTKYLKNTKGEIFQIVTSNFSYKYIDETAEQPFEISFDWIEVGVGEEGL
jgi:hypothetical protein